MLKFSIITVCFNSEKTILETIESVKNQTYKNYEHIIIDGKSTDKTLQIISEYMIISDKVILLSEKDNGIYNAMNKGIKLATGDLIVFLNSDDTFEKDALSLIEKNYSNEIDLIYGNVSWEENFNGHKFIKNLDLNPSINKGINEEAFSMMTVNHLKKIQNAHNATFVKTNLMKENLFDEDLKICSDYKFFLNMYINKCNVKYIPYKITTMKMGGISNTQLELTLMEHIKCENEVLGFITFNKKEHLIKIKIEQMIKKIAKKVLSDEVYIKNRYIKRGWTKKVIRNEGIYEDTKGSSNNNFMYYN